MVPAPSALSPLGVLPTAGSPFFMYTERSLDHHWLANCSGFREVRHGVRMQNTAEVGAYKVLRHHELRVRDPALAALFFVPIYPYVSKYVTAPCHGSASHRERMRDAAAALMATPQWKRFGGRDHFFVTTTWSTARASFRNVMYEMARALECGVAGRYKQFCPAACRLKSSSLAACTVHAPYQANVWASTHYRSHAARPTFVSFAGSFDVCCTGAAVRCRLAEYLVAVLDQPDVAIRPTLPGNATTTNGTALSKCTERAVALVAEELARRHGGAPADHRMHAIERLLPQPARADLRAGRRLGATWREAAVGETTLRADALQLASSVFCLTPAGDNCVSGRFYSAVAAGCIPVVVCPQRHPVAFERLVVFEPFWLFVTPAEWARPAALLARLRRMNATGEVRRYQSALARHRADLLYDVPSSRAGTNLLQDIARQCFSNATLADFASRGMCMSDGYNGTHVGQPWPFSAVNRRPSLALPMQPRPTSR